MNSINAISITIFLFSAIYLSSCRKASNQNDNVGNNNIQSDSISEKRYKRKRYRSRRKYKHKYKYKRKQKPIFIPKGKKLTAKVVHVVDADTVYLTMADSTRIKGRLAGINAPECHKKPVKTLDNRRSARCNSDDEAFGYKAFKYLNDMIYGKDVQFTCVKVSGTQRCKTGRFGRPLITIYFNGVDLNKDLVAKGFAFTFTKYPSKKRKEYCEVESKARIKKLGLWNLGRNVDEVLSLMSYKTRKWYKYHDNLCKEAR